LKGSWTTNHKILSDLIRKTNMIEMGITTSAKSAPSILYMLKTIKSVKTHLVQPTKLSLQGSIKFGPRFIPSLWSRFKFLMTKRTMKNLRKRIKSCNHRRSIWSHRDYPPYLPRENKDLRIATKSLMVTTKTQTWPTLDTSLKPKTWSDLVLALNSSHWKHPSARTMTRNKSMNKSNTKPWTHQCTSARLKATSTNSQRTTSQHWLLRTKCQLSLCPSWKN